MPDTAAEAILIAGGGRAILLQLAHPAIGHGVAQHSNFEHRPLDRLHATLSYVYAVAFGTEEDQQAVRRRVNRAHAPVRGDGDPETPAYSAFTPDLQLWVAATLYDSAMTVHRRVFGEPSDALADQLYQAYEALGTALQMPRGLWPIDREAFARYWDEQLAALQTDAVTRHVAHQLLHPRHGPVWLRAVMPLGRLVTTGLLPAELRDAFELPWTPRDERRFARTMRMTARLYPALPRGIRQWPKNHYLRQLRA
ncbi:oxygenase MpaB family protein [Glaciibacter psychrotolerans]|uniref:Uncharacterized protein (DUF2236 family) n=1 Tax=Glaciibacter psychrotolerans TaxID=670054 RepID=A0A7Z0EC94_9MICO|nr:oxygenase MpaB family protein [Leifsonia psychrotolerans]NYJ19002.1 uncharacterized protein (DUF2236 family) [Leifsonia psychrotolerans]